MTMKANLATIPAAADLSRTGGGGPVAPGDASTWRGSRDGGSEAREKFPSNIGK